MRIKYNPVIKGHQYKKILDVPTASQTMQSVEEVHRTPEEQEEYPHTFDTPGNPVVGETKDNSATDNLPSHINEPTKTDQLSDTQTIPDKPLSKVNNIPANKNEATNETVPENVKPSTSKPDKCKIRLPKCGDATNDVIKSKPSASIGPYNYVKFETSTGETLYFSKYFKLPKDLLPGDVSDSSSKRRRVRTAFTDAHVRKLDEAYSKSRYVNQAQRKQLALTLNLTERCVKLWFQNRRQREKPKLLNLDSDEEDLVTSVNRSKGKRPLVKQTVAKNSSTTNCKPGYSFIPKCNSSNRRTALPDTLENFLQLDKNVSQKRKHVDTNEEKIETDDCVVFIESEESKDITITEERDTDMYSNTSTSCKKRKPM